MDNNSLREAEIRATQWRPSDTSLGVELKREIAQTEKKLRKEIKLLKYLFWGGTIAGAVWAISRTQRRFNLTPKWGRAVSSVTGGHPEDMNGM